MFPKSLQTAAYHQNTRALALLPAETSVELCSSGSVGSLFTPVAANSVSPRPASNAKSLQLRARLRTVGKNFWEPPLYNSKRIYPAVRYLDPTTIRLVISAGASNAVAATRFFYFKRIPLSRGSSRRSEIAPSPLPGTKGYYGTSVLPRQTRERGDISDGVLDGGVITRETYPRRYR